MAQRNGSWCQSHIPSGSSHVTGTRDWAAGGSARSTHEFGNSLENYRRVLPQGLQVANARNDDQAQDDGVFDGGGASPGKRPPSPSIFRNRVFHGSIHRNHRPGANVANAGVGAGTPGCPWGDPIAGALALGKSPLEFNESAVCRIVCSTFRPKTCKLPIQAMTIKPKTMAYSTADVPRRDGFRNRRLVYILAGALLPSFRKKSERI